MLKKIVLRLFSLPEKDRASCEDVIKMLDDYSKYDRRDMIENYPIYDKSDMMI